MPAGSPARVHTTGCKDELHITLEPALVARVAAEAFDLDPARLSIPPLDGLDLPPLRAAMLAVDAELTAGGAGGRLAAEALATVLAVQLLRQVLAPRQTSRGRDGALPREKLRAVVDVHRGPPRRRPDPGATGCGRQPQPLPLRAAVHPATGMPPHQ